MLLECVSHCMDQQSQNVIEESNRCDECGELPELIEEAAENPLTGDEWDRYKCDCGHTTAQSVSGIERSAPPAYDSRDSAIQYVSIDLLENGFGADEQRELLEPVEEEVRQWMDTALHDGMRRAFRSDPDEGSEFAIEYLIGQLSFEDVPEEYRDSIESHITERLREKKRPLAKTYEDLMEDVLRKAQAIPEDEIANWGPVV